MTGIRMSSRQTSGRCCARFPPPRHRLRASAITSMSGWASRIIRSPVRTSSWSSAISTRTLTSTPVPGEHRGHGPPAPGKRSDLARAAEEGGSLAHSGDPVAGLSRPAGVAVVSHVDPDAGGGDVHVASRPGWRCARGGGRSSSPPGRCGTRPRRPSAAIVSTSPSMCTSTTGTLIRLRKSLEGPRSPGSEPAPPRRRPPEQSHHRAHLVERARGFALDHPEHLGRCGGVFRRDRRAGLRLDRDG